MLAPEALTLDTAPSIASSTPAPTANQFGRNLEQTRAAEALL